MGKLLVVTGYSGVGKDSIIDELLAKDPAYRRLVTCTDRAPRPGEIHGVHYYFVSPTKLDRMHKKGELVEIPLLYGTSRKATPKKEFAKVIYENASLVWRIESSLASSVASGAFFDEQFSAEEAGILKNSSIVVFVTAEKESIEARRRARDGEKYNPSEFAKRDRQDRMILRKHGKHFKHLIENKDKEISRATDAIIRLLKSIP